MSAERQEGGETLTMSSVEALQQMTDLLEMARAELVEAGFARQREVRDQFMSWPTYEYFADSQMPQYPRDKGSDRYQAMRKSQRENGYLQNASMTFDGDEERVKTASFTYYLPEKPGQDIGPEYLVFRVQMPKEVRGNGSRRMIIDIYECPKDVLGAKIRELEARHTYTDEDGRERLDSDGYNHDLSTEYNDIYQDLYKRSNNLGIPVLTRNHRRYVLGRDGFVDPNTQQELVNLAGIVSMSVQAGVEWKEAFANDPEEFREIAA